MADEMVLEVQKWLNTTYAGKAGYEKALEDGQTGWSTIYSLREGLQIETNAEGVGQGFGEATRAAVAKIVSQLKPGYANKNITKLIKGAFWCKGISPSDFSDDYSATTQAAFEELQSDAGLTANGVVTVNLMAALFDMSAFSLVASGKENVREMQQYLNGKFSDGLGQIMPCDGIYQRDTNTALIYALQQAEGMGKSANGVYGPGTIEKCPYLSLGATGDAVRVLQYGLIVNGFDVKADGNFTNAVGDAVAAFSTIMNLEPITGRAAGNRVMKGLLTSNGDTTRDSIACDTSKQLTDNDVVLLKKYGFSIVGRYLTGTVGIGENERDKNLTVSEIKRITSAGLSIFPIFQDGGATSDYFTSNQGLIDGYVAISTAKRLGFAVGTTIYFACDTDLLEGEIDATIGSYMRGVNTAFGNSPRFNIGIYGTRNVATHIINSSLAKYCFVSDMSTGYSGNLGFPMAPMWSFDQFIEYSIGSDLPVDQVATNTTLRDPGCKTFSPGSLTEADKIALVNKFMGGVIENPLEFSFEQEYSIPMPVIGLTLTWSAKEAVGNGSVKIKNGKLDEAEVAAHMQDELGNISDMAGYTTALASSGVTTFSSKISDGSWDLVSSVSSDGSVKVDITVNIIKVPSFETADVNVSITFEMKFSKTFFDDPKNTLTPNPLPVAQHRTFAANYSLAIPLFISTFVVGVAKIMQIIWEYVGPLVRAFA